MARNDGAGMAPRLVLAVEANVLLLHRALAACTIAEDDGNAGRVGHGKREASISAGFDSGRNGKAATPVKRCRARQGARLAGSRHH